MYPSRGRQAGRKIGTTTHLTGQGRQEAAGVDKQAGRQAGRQVGRQAGRARQADPGR